MSDKNFDDKIRKKLEHVPAEYSEKAWERLQKSLPIPWYLSFLRDYGLWLYGGVTTLALLTSYYTQQITKKENQLLHDKISTINALAPSTSSSDTVYVNKVQVDTVYITKIQKVNHYYPVELAKQGAGETNAEIKRQEDETQVLFSRNTTKKANQKQTAVSKKNLVNGFQKNTEESENKPFVGNRDLQIEEKAKPFISNGLSSEKAETISYARDRARPQEKTKVAEEVAELIIPEREAQKTEEKPNQKKIKLPQINARVGAAFDQFGNKFSSVGPAIEIFLGDRLSVNTGVLITGKNEVEYKIPKDFNKNTGKQFEDRYLNYIGPKPQKIEDIEIKTSFIKIPLSINYYVPLKHSLSFMVTTGTKFDVAVLESVEYKSTHLGEELKNKFENQYKPKIFNSLYYGMGLQYQHRRLFAQISPYFEFSFRQASYLMMPQKYGLGVNIKYSLKK
jgi:hypothetical protein